MALRWRRQVGRRLVVHGAERLGPVLLQPLDQLGHGGGGEGVVADDDVLVDAEQGQHDGGEHAGAVLARRAVEDRRDLARVGQHPQRVGEGGGSDVEHLDVERAEHLAGVGVGVELLGRPGAAQHGQVQVGDAEVLGLDAAVVDLGLGAQIEDGADPEERELVELVVGQAVQGVGPVQRAPADRLPGPAPVPAQVTEVERTLEAEPAVGVVGRTRRRGGRTPRGG